MGFPGTFTRSKSQLRSIPGNQAAYGPNGPGNLAPGRSASMRTRQASRGKYSAKFRWTFYLDDYCSMSYRVSEFGAVSGTQEAIKLVRGLPFRNKLDGGKKSCIWGQKNQIQPHCRVSTPLWAPGADSGQRKKTKSGAKFGPKNDCSARPWGRRVVILVSESCILVHHTGHSASVLRDSAVYLRKEIFLNMTPKRRTNKKEFPWGFPVL